MIFEFFSLSVFELIQDKANKELREKEQEYDLLTKNNFRENDEME
jgi:hypothetical protein